MPRTPADTGMTWEEIDAAAAKAGYTLQQCLFALSLPLRNHPSVDGNLEDHYRRDASPSDR